ncbi:MAG: class I SAM-dependent methyltransferase [Thermoleophilaceae bacterium]
MTEQTIDFDAIKQVQQQVWSAGDFTRLATTMTIVGEELCEAVDVLPGERVLDVACGNGNATLAAARRAWGGTVGLDYVPELLEHGRARAAVDGLDVEWVEGDAEQLPFEDASFDVVLSTFGVMFAPDQERAASELLRVCRPGGRIGMANWTPGGLVGQLMATVAKHAPPPPGVAPPPLWGTEERLRQLLGDGVARLDAPAAAFKNRYRSADHFLDFLRTHFGPVKVALEQLDEAGQQALAADIRDVLERFDECDGPALVAPAEYLEVVATRG